MEEIAFLGQIISKEGVKPDPLKIKAIQEWKSPRNVIEIWSFSGLVGYYLGFVKDFSTVAKPLTALLKKNTPFQWNEKCQYSFERLKEAFTTTPVLALPTRRGDYMVYTDASR